MKQASSAQPQSFAVIKSFNFFIYGAIAIYMSFFPLYLHSVGVSSFQIGVLLAGGPFISVLANPFWGYISDRWHNTKRVLLVLLFGNLILMQAAFIGFSYPVLVMIMLAYFFFESPLFSQSNSLILDTIEGTGRRFGEFRLWGSLGWALMAVSAGPVIGMIGIQRLWIVYSLIMLAAIVVALWLPRRNISPKSAAEQGSYASIFKNKWFIVFLLIGVLISIPNGMNSTFMPLYMSELGGTEGLIGLSAFLTSIFEIPVFLLFDRYMPKGKKAMIMGLALVSLLYSVRWLLMSAATSPYEVIGIQVMNSVTFGGFYYIGTQLTSVLVPQQFRASGQALYALSWGGVAGIIAGIAGGWVFQNLGAVTMYRLGSVLSLLSVAGFLLLYVLMRRAAGIGIDSGESMR